MNSGIKVALLRCPEVFQEVEKNYSEIYQASSIKDLIRLLIETEIDVVLARSDVGVDKLKKVFRNY